MKDKSELSKEAQELIKLVGDESNYDLKKEVDVAAVLKKHPELLSGLNEYMQWRTDRAMAIAKSDTARPVAHGAAAVVSKIRKTK